MVINHTASVHHKPSLNDKHTVYPTVLDIKKKKKIFFIFPTSFAIAKDNLERTKRTALDDTLCSYLSLILSLLQLGRTYVSR